MDQDIQQTLDEYISSLETTCFGELDRYKKVIPENQKQVVEDICNYMIKRIVQKICCKIHSGLGHKEQQDRINLLKTLAGTKNFPKS